MLSNTSIIVEILSNEKFATEKIEAETSDNYASSSRSQTLAHQGQHYKLKEKRRTPRDKDCAAQPPYKEKRSLGGCGIQFTLEAK
ncbi:hypothetical protein CEXT_95591 [Caerostris extrusa]|uniref:Uncharacterized protein n=1 Tax=Caerostris extrusa TaxID=172846 RepID=A0AAV4VEW5_CAEEX|nr:hypothetical protein CEXT_95591 [Caerostris extrusa]